MPKLLRRNIDSPLIQAIQSITGAGPEEAMGLGGPMAMGPATIQMAKKVAPGYSPTAWGLLKKFYRDLPKIFDYVVPEGAKVQPHSYFEHGYQPYSHDVSQARGFFRPPVGKEYAKLYAEGPGEIAIRELGKVGEEEITPIKQAFTGHHEYAHTAQGLREAFLRYVQEFKEPPRGTPKEIWEKIKPYYPVGKTSYNEVIADVIANRLSPAVPIEYGKGKALRYYDAPKSSLGESDKVLADLLRILKLGSLY